jgi:hypothetical protein
MNVTYQNFGYQSQKKLSDTLYQKKNQNFSIIFVFFFVEIKTKSNFAYYDQKILQELQKKGMDWEIVFLDHDFNSEGICEVTFPHNSSWDNTDSNEFKNQIKEILVKY